MSGALMRRALCRAARALGVRAESTAAPADAVASTLGAVPSSDPTMRPYYEQLVNMRVELAASPKESSPSERAGELALLRMHNSSLPSVAYEGHMIKARVLEVGRRTVTLDTGLKPARVSRADILPENIIGNVVGMAPRRPGELLVGDVVQVFLEEAGTPEGDFLVSGVQAAVQRRMAAVWNELEERKARGELVQGRILNAVWHGYAVGVAGVVAFLPAKQCSRSTARRIGQLQKFRIAEADRSRPSLVLADPYLYSAGPSQEKQQFVRRLPRSQEEAKRRQELMRVADELRSVLALRNQQGGGSSGSGSSGGSSSGAAPRGS